MRVLLSLFLLFHLTLFGADKYFCPMHCEGTKTYEKAGSCPVCHMYLEKEPEPGAETGPLSSKDYRVDMKTSVVTTNPNQEIEVTVTPKSTQNDSVLKTLEDNDGSELEVYVTNQDLAYMEYVIPKKVGDGSFTFRQTFYEPQNALLFVIFKPRGVRQQVFPMALKVEMPKSGKAHKYGREGSTVAPIPLKVSKFWYFVLVSEDTTYFVRQPFEMDSKTTKSFYPVLDEMKKKLPKPGKYFAFLQTGADPRLDRLTIKK